MINLRLPSCLDVLDLLHKSPGMNSRAMKVRLSACADIGSARSSVRAGEGFIGVTFALPKTRISIRGDLARGLFRILLLITLLLFSGTVPPARADAPASKRYRTTIPYTPSKYGQIIVQVRLSGGLTGTFVLDTGTSSTYVTDTLAAKMGLSPAPAVGTDGKPILLNDKQAQMVTVPLLQMSNFRLLNSPCLVLSQKSLPPLFGQPLDGILGAGVLTIYPMYFDFLKRQITLFSPSPLTVDELRSIGMEDALTLPVADLTSNNRFAFACPVVMANGANRVQENLLVDTGAGGTLISEDTARQLKLQPISDNRNSPTFFGNIVVRQTDLPTLSLGSLSVNNLRLRYTQGLSASFPTHIGLDVLSQFRVLLDYKQKKMYLKPLSALAPVKGQTTPQADEGKKGNP